jgi:tRNA(fMet)-specific endonuclease VapC
LKYLIDTNIISEIISKKPNEKVLKFLLENNDNIFLSVVTIGEINKGIEKLDNSIKKDNLKEWLQSLLSEFEGKILKIDIYTMLIWSDITANLQKKGIQLSIMDGLIASSAIEHNMVLVTRNVKYFEFIDSLEILNPF